MYIKNFDYMSDENERIYQFKQMYNVNTSNFIDFYYSENMSTLLDEENTITLDTIRSLTKGKKCTDFCLNYKGDSEEKKEEIAIKDTDSSERRMMALPNVDSISSL